MKFKDSRLKIMNEILNGIKVSTSIHILICPKGFYVFSFSFSLTFIFHAVPPDPKAVRVGAIFPSPGGRHQGE